MKITLALDPASLDYVYKLLATRPWGEVNALVLEIQRQVVHQQRPQPPVHVSQAAGNGQVGAGLNDD